MENDAACVWGLSHTPHGGVLFRRVRAITRVAQCQGEISTEGISTAERFSSKAVMPVITTADEGFLHWCLDARSLESSNALVNSHTVLTLAVRPGP